VIVVRRKMKMINQEMRTTKNEFRTVENENGDLIIEGYAIVFNQPATHGFTEIIDSKALDKTDMSDVVLRYNHNDSFLILARTRNKSLELLKDNYGLKIRATLQKDIADHVNIYNAIKSQLIDKQSFAFSVTADEYDYDNDTRTITEIGKLYDVSVVDFPFYSGTSISTVERTNDDSFLIQRAKLREKVVLDLKKDILKKLI
jgi:HK97 family phage prohead protease